MGGSSQPLSSWSCSRLVCSASKSESRQTTWERDLVDVLREPEVSQPLPGQVSLGLLSPSSNCICCRQGSHKKELTNPCRPGSCRSCKLLLLLGDAKSRYAVYHWLHPFTHQEEISKPPIELGHHVAVVCPLETDSMVMANNMQLTRVLVDVYIILAARHLSFAELQADQQ